MSFWLLYEGWSLDETGSVSDCTETDGKIDPRWFRLIQKVSSFDEGSFHLTSPHERWTFEEGSRVWIVGEVRAEMYFGAN